MNSPASGTSVPKRASVTVWASGATPKRFLRKASKPRMNR